MPSGTYNKVDWTVENAIDSRDINLYTLGHSLLFSYSQNSGDSNFFARKFEAIVNQHIINEIDAYLYGPYLATTPGLNSYWENAFHDEDDVTQPSSARYTVYNSFMRQGQKQVGSNLIDDVLVDNGLEFVQRNCYLQKFVNKKRGVL